MHKIHNAYRSTASAPASAGRAAKTRRIVKAAAGSYFWIVALLIWAVFYQNLPDIAGMFSDAGGGAAGAAGAAADTGTEGGVANEADRIIKIGMLGISFYLIASKWSIARALVRNLNPGILALYGLAGLSMAWSVDPSATMLRFISLSAVMFACFAFGLAGWNERRLQQVIVPPMLLILALSLVVGSMNPKLVTEVGDSISLKDAWRGIMLTKNMFGMTASACLVVCANVLIGREKRPWWAIPGAVAGALCLALSRSNTSMLAACVAIAVMLLVMRVPVVRQRYTTHVAVSAAVIILIYELVTQHVLPGMDVLFAPITYLTGKDTTFSARSMIWDVIKEHISYNPYLGTGYGAYWVGPVPTSASYIFMYVMQWYPTESHNGYLEVTNDLGRLGLGCVLVLIYCYVRQVLKLMRIDRAQAALFLGLLLQEMILNMSESDWLSRSNNYMILTLAAVCMARALDTAKVGSPQAGGGGGPPLRYRSSRT